MNSEDLDYSPDLKYPEIKLDIIDYIEHLSNEYICGEVNVKNDSVRINPKKIVCLIKDRADLRDISSVPINGADQEEMVRIFRCRIFQILL